MFALYVAAGDEAVQQVQLALQCGAAALLLPEGAQGYEPLMEVSG